MIEFETRHVRPVLESGPMPGAYNVRTLALEGILLVTDTMLDRAFGLPELPVKDARQLSVEQYDRLKVPLMRAEMSARIHGYAQLRSVTLAIPIARFVSLVGEEGNRQVFDNNLESATKSLDFLSISERDDRRAKAELGFYAATELVELDTRFLRAMRGIV